MDDAREIAGRLSAAQVSYLTDKAQWRKPRSWAQERWMTFPPANVHRVLQRLDLVDGVGQIQDLGLQVRQVLQERQDG